MKLDPYLSPCKKIDSKWIKLDLNMKTEPVRTNGCILHDKDVWKYFLKRNPFAQMVRPRIDKWDFMQLKYFSTDKETNHKHGEEEAHRIRENLFKYKNIESNNQ